MPETIVQQPQPTATVVAPAPVSTAPAVPPVVEQKQEESLIKRAAAIQTPPTPNGNEPPKVNISIEEVKDPIARQILEKKLEEANKGISEAFGKVGAEKSKYLQEIERLKSESNKPWTPERLQQEINRQDFIQSATILQNSTAPNGVQQETWSSWSPEEKQAFQRQQQETQVLKQQLEFMQQSQVISAVDNELKEEYPDYDSAHINEFYRKAQMQQLTPKQVREAIYWGTRGKDLVSRAYELGKQDAKTTLNEKINGITPRGNMNVTPTTNNEIEKKAGQRSSTVFSSHAHKVLDMIKGLPKK